MITARLMQFSSSRTLPVHGYASIRSMASGDNVNELRRCSSAKRRVNACASKPGSPGRFRSGGISSTISARRKYRSSRKLPCPIISFRFLCVAQTMRTSTGISSRPPTRSMTRSCRKRNSFPCNAGERSPISSRKSVPLFAVSIFPGVCFVAPVKAPFS